MRFRRALLVLTAFLLFALAWGGPWSDLNAKLQKAPDAKVARIVRESQTNVDDQLAHLLPPDAAPEALQERAAVGIRGYVTLRAKFERQSSSTDANDIKAIKASSLYRSASSDNEENWLGKAIDRIRAPRWSLPPPQLGSGIATPYIGGLQFVIWIILGAAVVVLAFFAIRAFALRKGARRQAGAMLEDDEPERPLDEWLQLADQLEREGKFREAVRCLYVACLLRYDEARVARFDRTHTNWEHFKRIVASPVAPQEFDFRTPTRDFDRIWYGHAHTEVGDVQRFRTTYTTLTGLLKQTKSGAAA